MDDNTKDFFLLCGLLVFVIGLSVLGVKSCTGNSEEGTAVVGQIKSINRVTPIICPAYTEADISLGVMRNGVGSMSVHDITLTLPSSALSDAVTQAQQSGTLVKVTQDVRRFSFCTPERIARKIEPL